MTVEKSTAVVAERTCSRPMRVKRKAMTTVAKTSKKPSTQRCTTHQRQYSAMAEVRVPAPHQAGAVEEGDGGGGDQEQAEQAGGCSPGLRKAGHKRADHQAEPEEQADEQEDLPEAAEVDVLVALGGRTRSSCRAPCVCCMPSHSPASEPTTMMSRQTKRKLTPDALVACGSWPETAGRDEQAGGQPGGGDPEDAELRVPGARHRVGQPFGQRDAVEARSPRRRSGR